MTRTAHPAGHPSPPPQELPSLTTLNISGRRLQPRLDTVLAADVTLCTLETLTRHCKPDPPSTASTTATATATTPATASAAVIAATKPRGTAGAAGPGEWHTRKPLGVSNQGQGPGQGRARRRGGGGGAAECEPAPVAPPHRANEPKSVLHRVRWHRVVIDDGHTVIKGALTARQARLAALSTLPLARRAACWALVESSRAPKLGQTRAEMRGVMNAIRAHPEESLVDLVPRRMKFID